MDLALNNLQRLICYKTQTTNQPLEKFVKPFVCILKVFDWDNFFHLKIL